MKKVVIFNGSPRKDGNITTILDTIAQGVRDTGAEASYHILFKMKFMACQGCFACRLQGDCIINDEVHDVLQKVKEADAVVIGSPIYMMQVTGPVKNLYDRLYPLMDINCTPRYGRKKFVAVYSQGTPDPDMYRSYFDYTAAMYPAYGFDLIDTLVCTNATDPEAADKNKALKQRAYDLGQSLVL